MNLNAVELNNSENYSIRNFKIHTGQLVVSNIELYEITIGRMYGLDRKTVNYYRLPCRKLVARRTTVAHDSFYDLRKYVIRMISDKPSN